ncbi:hypothetical protein GCM10010524_04320 [Streptomyces mexicanus]
MLSGAVCAGSNPAGGTLCKCVKDPVTSGNAEYGVFVFVQACAARSGRMSGSVDETWTGSWSIAAGEVPEKAKPAPTQGAPTRNRHAAGATADQENCRHLTAATNSGLSPRLTMTSNAVHLLHLVGREDA